MSVTLGDPANFSCSATGSEVTIEWTVDGEGYGSCPQEEGAAGCSEISHVNETEIKSTLSIPSTTVLGVGIHLVECVVRQNIAELFAQPFEERRNATLRIFPSTSHMITFYVSLVSPYTSFSPTVHSHTITSAPPPQVLRARALEKQGSGQTRIGVWFLHVQEFLGHIIARKVGVM